MVAAKTEDPDLYLLSLRIRILGNSTDPPDPDPQHLLVVQLCVRWCLIRPRPKEEGRMDRDLHNSAERTRRYI